MGTLLDLFRRAAPQARPPERPVEPAPRSSRSYDGAGQGYRTEGWLTSSTSALSETAGGLVSLRNRSRDLVRNTAWGRRIIDAMVSGVVGTGIRPTLNTGSKDLDAAALKAWNDWSADCYPSNRTNVYALQTMLARAWFESGEVVARRRRRRDTDMPGLVPLQIQVFEGDQLDHTKTEQLSSGSIVQGVEFDPLGRRVAYHMLKSHPGDAVVWVGTSYESVRVPADGVLHLYQEARPGQVRGVPWMHAVIPAVWDLAGYADAERMRAKAASCVMAFVEGGDPEYGVPPGVDGLGPAEDEETPGEVAEDSDGNPIEQLRPGWIAYLPTGKTVTINQPGTAAGYKDYVNASLHEIASGVGLSYSSLSGDMGDANFAQGKLGQNEQNRLHRSIREQVFIPFAMDPIWAWFVDAAITAGILPNDQALYAVKWSTPQIVSVDPLTDAKAHKAQMRDGTHSRREIIAARGRDPDEVDAEIKADKDARDPLGIILDSDPSQTTTSGSVQSQNETGGGGDAESA
jgi:lambda family phage portal protein